MFELVLMWAAPTIFSDRGELAHRPQLRNNLRRIKEKLLERT